MASKTHGPSRYITCLCNLSFIPPRSWHLRPLHVHSRPPHPRRRRHGHGRGQGRRRGPCPRTRPLSHPHVRGRAARHLQPHPPVQRPRRLSRIPSKLWLNPLEWYENHGVRVHAGVKAELIDRDTAASSSAATARSRSLTTTSSWPPGRGRSCRRWTALEAAGRFRLPHPRRLRGHRVLRPANATGPSSSAAGCSGWKRRAGCSATTSKSPSSRSPRT